MYHCLSTPSPTTNGTTSQELIVKRITPPLPGEPFTVSNCSIYSLIVKPEPFMNLAKSLIYMLYKIEDTHSIFYFNLKLVRNSLSEY